VLARCGSTLDQSFPSTFGSAARAITKGRGVTRDREWSSSKVSDLIPAIGGCLSGEASWGAPAGRCVRRWRMQRRRRGRRRSGWLPLPANMWILFGGECPASTIGRQGRCASLRDQLRDRAGAEP